MYSFAMLRSAGQKLYEIFLWCSLFRGVHYIRINRYTVVLVGSYLGIPSAGTLPRETREHAQAPSVHSTKSVLFCYTIPRHYLTCATPGTINPRRAYDWRAESDADYLLLTA